MKAFRRGLVVGKFTPLHRGHQYLIDTALANCEELVVITYANPHFGFHNDWKRKWFAKLYPQVYLIAPTDEIGPNLTIAPKNEASEEEHRQFCASLIEKHDKIPDVVFTSETYGEPFVEWMNARWKTSRVRHIMVDGSRRVVPISGTRLREQNGVWKSYVDPYVAANRTRKLVLYGGESSGKTTLAYALSKRTGWQYVMEVGREYTERLGGVKNLKYEDMLKIGKEQVSHEQFILGLTAMPWIICDTSPLTTQFYSEALFGKADPVLQFMGRRTHYDVAFLLDNAHGWTQDGDRMSPEFSKMQHDWYEQNIYDAETLHHLEGGTVEERVDRVLAVLDGMV